MPTDSPSFGQSLEAMSAQTTTQMNLLSSGMNYMAQHPTFMTPSAMLMLQWQMTLLSQTTETMSNLLAGMNSMMQTMIRNLKGG